MTDPERIGRSGSGLAAQLLRSVESEQPSHAGMQRTLAALGVSGAVLTTTSAASAAAAASGAKVTTAVAASAGKSVTALLLVKWVGVGVVGGVGLAGAATIMTTPAEAPPAAISVPAPRRVVAPVASQAAAPVAAPVVAAPEPVATSPSPRPSVRAPEPAVEATPDVGALLAAEVAFVDRARGLLAAGQAEAGLLQLSRYEREFPEARLLPEVLFLQLEAYQRLGRKSDARRAAERIVSSFPKSPHAARARAVLGGPIP